MNILFKLIAHITLLFYPLALSNKISRLLDKIYTWRILSKFGSVGGVKC